MAGKVDISEKKLLVLIRLERVPSWSLDSTNLQALVCIQINPKSLNHEKNYQKVVFFFFEMVVLNL